MGNINENIYNNDRNTNIVTKIYNQQNNNDNNNEININQTKIHQYTASDLGYSDSSDDEIKNNDNDNIMEIINDDQYDNLSKILQLKHDNIIKSGKIFNDKYQLSNEMCRYCWM